MFGVAGGLAQTGEAKRLCYDCAIDPSQGPPMKTVLVAIAFAALFSTVATQFYTLIVPTRSALWLLLLFFMVGLGVAWITMRADARDAKRDAAAAGDEALDMAPGEAPDADQSAP